MLTSSKKCKIKIYIIIEVGMLAYEYEWLPSLPEATIFIWPTKANA